MNCVMHECYNTINNHCSIIAFKHLSIDMGEVMEFQVDIFVKCLTLKLIQEKTIDKSPVINRLPFTIYRPPHSI